MTEFEKHWGQGGQISSECYYAEKAWDAAIDKALARIAIAIDELPACRQDELEALIINEVTALKSGAL